MEEKKAFQVDYKDNVATSLYEVRAGEKLSIVGDHNVDEIIAETDIPKGHKIALCDIKEDCPIIKYGVVIGKSTRDISMGEWVHLHVMRSLYDERSDHLDVVTGAPKDTKYE